MTEKNDLKPVFDFLTDLATHNNRPWFEAQKSRYEDARRRMEALVGHIILASPELSGVAPKDCLYRIYRDVRFAKDKSPYKTSFAAVIAPGGKKSRRQPFYLHLEPGGSVFAGGLWDPSSAELKAFRADMDDGPRAFLGILNNPGFKRHYHLMDGVKLKRMPPGYDTDHPAGDLLKLKQICVIENLSDQAVLAKDFPERALDAYRTIRPFLEYLEEVLGVRS